MIYDISAARRVLAAGADALDRGEAPAVALERMRDAAAGGGWAHVSLSLFSAARADPGFRPADGWPDDWFARLAPIQARMVIAGAAADLPAATDRIFDGAGAGMPAGP